MPTLRSWELRYAIPATDRPLGKHRRYTPDELHALRLMRDEIARGKRASTAAQSVRALLGMTGPAARSIEALLAASGREDPAAIRNELDSAMHQLGLAHCIDDVIFPAMKQIGLWWQTGRCDIAQERLTTETVRSWLDSRAASAPAPVHPNPIVLACGPADLHTLGMEALAVLLRQHGRSCRLLGARTPTPVLRTAALASAASAVVVVSHLNTGRRRAVESLTAIAELDMPLFYAGNAFTSPISRRGLPGQYLGARMEEACSLIHTALPGS
jgi:methanogenic corrinoid protein MtbC1